LGRQTLTSVKTKSAQFITGNNNENKATKVLWGSKEKTIGAR